MNPCKSQQSGICTNGMSDPQWCKECNPPAPRVKPVAIKQPEEQSAALMNLIGLQFDSMRKTKSSVKFGNAATCNGCNRVYDGGTLSWVGIHQWYTITDRRNSDQLIGANTAFQGGKSALWMCNDCYRTLVQSLRPFYVAMTPQYLSQFNGDVDQIAKEFAKRLPRPLTFSANSFTDQFDRRMCQLRWAR